MSDKIPLRDNYVLVPVAIREGELARLHFPSDITKAEAEKVARVILAYASVDGRPKAGDAAQTAAPLATSAVPSDSEGDAQK